MYIQLQRGQDEELIVDATALVIETLAVRICYDGGREDKYFSIENDTTLVVMSKGCSCV